jgi:multimeric flavodoxin WrbA
VKALILNGAHEHDTFAEVTRRLLDEELAAQGWEPKWYDLAGQKIAPCMGEFSCWMRTPGICMSDDINREIAREMIQSDLTVLFTPITFGGYSSELKKAVDHFLPNILPFFSWVNGEVHHTKRYARYPDLLALGWLPQPDEESEAIFRALVHRNSINFYSPSHVCQTLHAGKNETDARARIRRSLESLRRGGDTDAPVVEDDSATVPSGVLAPPPKEALLLIGSPRVSKSTSAALGNYLMEELAASGLRTSTLHVQTILQTEEGTRDLAAAALRADLVILSLPLYIDSIPAPLIRALELLARERSRTPSSKTQLLSVIINCGFPEAAHARTAMAICRQFARQAGFAWSGGMLLGGGEGLVHGTPLRELDGRARPLISALDSAAAALHQGTAIPREARTAFARSIIPAWLYFLFGSFGWRMMARRYRTGRKLRAQPYMA